jgi:hypothetical protein
MHPLPRRLVPRSSIQLGAVVRTERILVHCEPLIRSILEFRNTTRHESIDELLSRIRIKLWRSIKLFNPAKGTAFSFVARVISSTAASIVSESWARNGRFCQFDETVDSVAVCDPVRSTEAISDIQFRVRQVKTPCTDLCELAAQKWLVESFLDAEFALRRHEAANSMMAVYNFGHSESRRLFDLTLIAIWRELLTGRRLAPVNPRSLAQTRSEAIIKYARFLSVDEFTQLAVLFKDVAPSVVLTIDPSRACAIRRGEFEAVRMNLDLILNGSPTDQRLFP